MKSQAEMTLHDRQRLTDYVQRMSLVLGNLTSPFIETEGGQKALDSINNNLAETIVECLGDIEWVK